ncbi:hypothetical protein L596_026115 [Steinernema carpocapsae]|uniref:Uncharacterized protein n=1 Tax=Steinernema carpocapsae TaxID=34508 RepID=A0A4U5M1D8_STECR|nr:hypothetical protein L596_026115 [Steinernema carpocapsae]
MDTYIGQGTEWYNLLSEEGKKLIDEQDEKWRKRLDLLVLVLFAVLKILHLGAPLANLGEDGVDVAKAELNLFQ